jgi:predicted component of type VI protein secretion system
VLGGVRFVTWTQGTGILLSGLLSLAALVQRPSEHFRPPVQAGQPKDSGEPRNPNRPNKGAQQPNRRMGDWLQNHKDLSPDQQEKLLENDPHFKRLPPERQAELKERLRRFNGLTPEQRERALNRMQWMASLTQEQRQNLRDANQKLQGLPQERQMMVHKALRHLRQMDPQERQQVLASDRLKSTFSEQEQGILKQLSAINPPEGGDNTANPQPVPNGQPK